MNITEIAQMNYSIEMNCSEDTKSLFSTCLKKWGADAQVAMILEECLELASAIHKHRRKDNSENIIDEIADVKIMLMQAEMIFDLSKIDERVSFKLNRLKNRIDSSQFTPSCSCGKGPYIKLKKSEMIDENNWICTNCGDRIKSN